MSDLGKAREIVLSQRIEGFLPLGATSKLIDAIASALSDVRAQERERCAKIADTGMLTPPDGGSPTQEECDIALNIAAAIRASQDNQPETDNE